ncbi:SRPBCC family protein [Cryptosporangium phraense]|uniref:SRPBCC family protein n=1 Tax=Cryptosporangium phraense TaxID=2593070 RepID=A0A545AZ70_9ACTN|nr:SRPBCC family protein [Cryptosporangium phraense]TQS46632.1 SRPBCC family protein [Cryptosporangium phraense]
MTLPAVPADLARPGPGTLTVRVMVDADIETAFAAATDWPAQARWIPLTSVKVVEGDGRSLGSVVHAFTGIGRVGFLDVFTVVGWDPPHSVQVVHTGRLIRGPGAFHLTEYGRQRTEFAWSEELYLPFGRAGEVAWAVARPLAAAALKAGLRRFARYVVSR